MEINLKEKYLPLGTVVLLKGGKKRVMVTGFCVVSPEIEKKVFDYCGCIYPEGYLNSAQNCLFNHDQIDKIYHVGLVDDEEMKFKTQLKEVAPQIDETFAEFVRTANQMGVKALEEDAAPVTADEPVVAMPTVAETPVASEPVVEQPSVIDFINEQN